MINRKLNVLFLPKWYPSKFEEFDGNFIENHAIALAKKCNLGVVFAHSDPELKELYTVEKTSAHGFPEYRVYYKRPHFGFKLINQLVAFIRFRKAQLLGYQSFVEELGKPDLCHVHINGKSALLANFLKATQKIPFIITEHWSGYTAESKAFKGFFRKRFYQYTAKESSGITCVSNYLKTAIESHQIKSSFSIVPNVVDTDLFQPNPKKSKQPIRIVHISNLSKTPKNIHLIAQALNKAGLHRNDFEVDFIGTGPDENLLLEKLRHGSLKNRHVFHGEIELTQVAKVLQNANFLLLYSQFETQSVVMLEAFACGIPVLSSSVGGIPEYLNEERGILLEANSAEVLEKGILEMLNRYHEFDQKKLRKYAVENFGESAIQQQFLVLYQKIITTK